MIPKPRVSRINIFPVKSLDGFSLQEVIIAKGGCLLHDREFAMADETGKLIIGKTNPRVYLLRSKVDFERNEISLRHQDALEWHTFHLLSQKEQIEAYLTMHFGFQIKFHQEKTGRFLDIPDLSGITVLSQSSLETVTSWFDYLHVEETRNRFRASIELEGVPAFWEDQLFGEPGSIRIFQIGDVKVGGVSPRARCTVPPHHTKTGQVITGFQKMFASKRAACLPDWSLLKQYGHYYHMAVDCHLPDSETGKVIRIGDELQIIAK